jgi:hypothetical protein
MEQRKSKRSDDKTLPACDVCIGNEEDAEQH